MGIFKKIGEFLASPITGLAKDFTEARKYKKLKQADMLEAYAQAEAQRIITETQAAAEIAKADAMLRVKQAEHSANWEVIQAQQAATSWKDEYGFVVITIPFVAYFTLPIFAFFAGMEDRIDRVYEAYAVAWEQLTAAPPEFWGLVTGAYAAVFGLRGLAKLGERRKGNNNA